MRTIILIDDQDYGLEQIENAIPAKVRPDYQIHYFQSYTDYTRAGKPPVFVAVLDFYLEPGQPHGSDIAREIPAEIVVGFSSVPSASQSIVRAALNGRRHGYPPVKKAFAAQKMRGTRFNDTLIEIFLEIL